jgi:hypothetical protein
LAETSKARTVSGLPEVRLLVATPVPASTSVMVIFGVCVVPLPVSVPVQVRKPPDSWLSHHRHHHRRRNGKRKRNQGGANKPGTGADGR